jgi:hypothetical protein
MKVEQGRGLISKCEREKTQIKSLENENENKKTNISLRGPL